MKINGLKFIEETNWENVFFNWKEREGKRLEWQKVATEKGWNNWDEWRSNWVKTINAKDKKWSRYEIINPFKLIPNFLVGPSQSWQKIFSETEKNTKTFAEIIKKVDYKKNKKITSLLNDFPSPTEFIGIIHPNKKITLIEGHHRAAAIAQSVQNNLELKISTSPTIALTFFNESEKELIEKMLQKGSRKK